MGQRYEGEERLIALAIAARSAAGPAAERNENVPMPPPYDWERTARWVRSFSRDRMGNRIERCLYTAWTEGDGDRILPLLLALRLGALAARWVRSFSRDRMASCNPASKGRRTQVAVSTRMR